MRKSNVAIACLLAAGLMAPGAASAWGDKAKTTQAANTTSTTATNTSSGAREAMSDATITTKVKAEFAKEKNVSATHIKVDTDNGVVKLSGTARSQQEADRAAQIARDTKGVTSVENNIQVVAGAK
jgi:hyperosmotically inducible protein